MTNIQIYEPRRAGSLSSAPASHLQPCYSDVLKNGAHYYKVLLCAAITVASIRDACLFGECISRNSRSDSGGILENPFKKAQFPHHVFSPLPIAQAKINSMEPRRAPSRDNNLPKMFVPKKRAACTDEVGSPPRDLDRKQLLKATTSSLVFA